MCVHQGFREDQKPPVSCSVLEIPVYALIDYPLIDYPLTRLPAYPITRLTLIVFDLDGTLIDSRHDLADAANALIVESGGRPLPVEAITSMVGEGAPLLVRRALKAAGVDVDVRSALARFLELYDERLLVHTRLYDGTKDALEALAPRATLAILTNKPQRPTERILDGLAIASFFRWTIGGDTAHGRKPDPAGLDHLMSAAGTAPSDTVMVGDSAIDLRTARAAGTRVCLVRYGFGFRTAVSELAGDELIADDPSQLATML
jgi:phosphoglycolate phosphatase